MRRPQSVPMGETFFRGIDQYNPAQLVPPGFLAQCDNLVVEGSADDGGGELVTRRGKLGMFPTKLAGPIHCLFPVQQSNGTVVTLFTSGGKLYKSTLGSNTYSEILQGGISLNLVSENTFMAQAGGRVYIVDGSGPLRYTDLTGAFAVAGLQKPLQPPAVGLTNIPLLPTPGTGTWVQDESAFTVGGGELIGDPNFETAFWDYISGATPGNIADGNGDMSVELDDPGEGALSQALVPLHTGEATPRYNRVFRLTYEHSAEDSNSSVPTERVYAELQAFSSTDGTGAVAGRRGAYSDLASEDTSVRTSQILDFRGLATEPKSVRLLFEQRDDHGGTRGVDVNRVTLQNVPQVLDLQRGAAGELVVNQGSVAVQDEVLLTSGLRFFVDMGGSTDWSRKSRLTLNLRPGSGVQGLRARLYFRQVGTNDFDSATRTYTNEAVYLDSGTEAVVDISTVDPTKRNSFRYLGVELIGDVTIPGATDNSNVNIATLGAVTEAGNLPVGYGEVSYVLVEVDSAGDPVNLLDVLESDGSPRTQGITPDDRRAVGELTLPARTNPSATHAEIYRFDGLSGDGRGRLIASIRYGQASFGFGGAPPVGLLQANPYLQWTAPIGVGTAGGKLLDNTPGTWLVSPAKWYEPGRNSAPEGAVALAEFANRLWLLTATGLYGSWLMTEGKKNGLYFTTVPLDVEGDPSALLKGFYTPVGGDVKDPNVALIPFLDRLIVTKSNTRPHMLLGTNPINFELRPFTGANGVGHVARRAYAVWHGAIYYLSADGIIRFDTRVSELTGRRLQRLINGNLVAGGVALKASAYAQSYMFTHGGDLYLGTPSSPLDNNPTVLFRFDGTSDELVPTRLLPFLCTGGVQASGTADTSSLLLAGRDGQLYSLASQTGDRETPAGAAVAVSWALETRRWGQDTFQAEKTPLRLIVDVQGGGQVVPVTMGVIGAKEDVELWTATYSVPSNTPHRIRKKVREGVRGRLMSARLSGQSISPFRIRAIQLECSAGRIGTGH